MKIQFCRYLIVIFFLNIAINLTIKAQSPGGVSTGLTVWVDASDIDGDGTPEGASEGGLVSGNVATWTDKSGQSNDLTNSTTTQRPTPILDVLNSHSVIDFTSDRLFAPDTDQITANGDYTKIVVFTFNGTSANNIIGSKSTGGSTFWGHSSTSQLEMLNTDGGGSTSFASTDGLNNNQYYLGVGRYGAGTGARTNIINVDGNEGVSNTTAQTHLASEVQVGAFSNGNFFNGDIAETAVYNRALTDAEIDNIESYLAIKYGMTITHNYTSSSSTILWNATTNSSYLNDITGIGRDDNSGLDQQKSLSINVGSAITIDKGAAFGSDGDFIIWGNNGITGANTADVPSGYTTRTSRIWKAAIAGTPGTVSFSIDINILGIKNTGVVGDYALLIDTNETFATGATEHTTGASLVGSTLTFTSVSLSNNNFFSIAGPGGTAPSGISSSLTLWVDANDIDGDGSQEEGSETGLIGGLVATWTDKSGNVNNLTGTARPSLVTDTLNYNSVLDFASDRLFAGDADQITANGAYTKIVVFSYDAVAANNIIASTGSGGSTFWAGTTSNSVSMWNLGGGGPSNPGFATATGLVIEQYYIGIGRYGAGGSETNVINIDGTQQVSNTTVQPHTANAVQLGAFAMGSFLNGKIAEVIVYDKALTNAEIDKIESYLAIKYGITISHDYLLSNDSIIWDLSANTNYNNQIIGIVKDESSDFIQKQSQTLDDSTRIYVSTLTISNATNTGTIANDTSSIVLGHNNGILHAYSSNMERPIGLYARFEREWKVENVNFTDEFTLEITWDSLENYYPNDLRLLVDSDGDFSNATIFDNTDGITFNVEANIISGIDTAHIPLNSIRYITIASIAVASSTILPIELLSFKALPINNSVELTWKTASETNNDFFTIEKSHNNSDWEEVTRLDGAGNSSTVLSYSTVDKNPYAGTSYYRLKQTDFDGKYEYSKVRAISMKNFSNKLIIFPNPTDGVIHLKGENLVINEIRVYNTVGQNLTSHLEITVWDEKNATINFSNIPNGLYTVNTKDFVSKVYKK